MQTFGLPRQITRGAALASRLGGAERSGAKRRQDAMPSSAGKALIKFGILLQQVFMVWG